MKYNIAWIAKKKYDDWKASNPLGNRFVFDIVKHDSSGQEIWDIEKLQPYIDAGKLKTDSNAPRIISVIKGSWSHLASHSSDGGKLSFHIHCLGTSNYGHPENMNDFYDSESNTLIFNTTDLNATNDVEKLSKLAEILDKPNQDWHDI